MSRVDRIFIEKAEEILEEGYSERDVNSAVRPVWSDGDSCKSAYTKYITQEVIEYKEGEVPILNLRRIAWKSAIKEILWIYKDKCNNVANLKSKYNVNYWDSWANEEGSLGTAYGYQTGKTFKSPETGNYINQVDRLIEQLRENPLNRRLIISLYDVDDLAEMTLVPCAFLTMWSVRGDKLDMTLVQRSGDFLAAAGPGGINSFQYYVFLRMIAQVTGFKPGKFMHIVQNLHIYDRHMDIVKSIVEEDHSKEGPSLWVNPEVKELKDFTINDFRLEGYNPSDKKYDIPIAL